MSASWQSSLFVAGALVLVLLLGLLTLWTPFSVDQAIFAYGAGNLLSGGVLYVDFWDIKQPGIFFLFALGQRLFGPGEVGVHLVELAWMTAAFLGLLWVARRGLRSPAAVALAPVAAVGVYFAFAEGEHRTQVEALMVLPAILALAASVELARRPEALGPSLLLGVSSGVVAALKLLYGVLPAAFLAVALVAGARRHGRQLVSRLPRIAAGVILGLLAVLLPVVFYFAARDAISELLWTTFSYPTETLKEVAAAPGSRLEESSLWAFRIYLPWLPLVALGLFSLGRLRDPVVGWTTGLYLFLAAGLIYLQRTSWWSYHMVLLFPPLGLLAAFGADRLREILASRRPRAPLAVLLAALLVAPPLTSLVWRAAARARQLQRAVLMESEAPLAVRLDHESLKIWEGTAFLRHHGRPGDIYVLGDPRILWLAERRQAIPVHGHGWEHLPSRMWERLPGEVIAARPVYVFVSPYNWDVLERRAPELVEFLERDYRPARRIVRGRLLARKE